MNAEFNWWLLIVGLVLGAALTWLVMAETVRRDVDITEREQQAEATWIAALLRGSGPETPPERVEEILRLHREYLAAPPPDGMEAAPERRMTDDAVVASRSDVGPALDGGDAERGDRPA